MRIVGNWILMTVLALGLNLPVTANAAHFTGLKGNPGLHHQADDRHGDPGFRH
jgi:hypothetical protein